MCDGHDHDHAAGPLRTPVTRRSVLRGAGLLAAASSVPLSSWWGGVPASAATAGPIKMGLHVHASFSEGVASIGSQLECARNAGVDVVWFTEHDWRMAQHNYRTRVSFDSLTHEQEFGREWRWEPVSEGAPTAVAGGIVSTPVSATDPSTTPGALRAKVTASSAATGDSYLWFAQAGRSRHNQRGNIAGTTLTIDVYPQQISSDAWGELRILLSNHPATASRPAGQYVLSYRFGAAGASTAQGFTGIVPLQAKAGRWTTLTVNPLADVGRLWPDLVAEDNSLADLWLGATARRSSSADVVFDNLRFHRTQPASLSPFGLQASMLARYAPAYPQVTAITAQEISFMPEHLGWLGGDDFLMPYDTTQLAFADDPADANARARAALARRGAIAINHPFGAEGTSVTTPSRAIPTLAAQYLQYQGYGASMLEVGYAQRGGATLDEHLALWDVLCRNGLYLTGTGVNDNHDGLNAAGTGLSWDEDINRFTTSVWAGSTSESALIAQLRTGRAFCSEVTERNLSISVRAKGVPMGAVSVRPTLTSRPIIVEAQGLSAGYTVTLLQGAVDYAADLSPNSHVVTVLSAAALHSGSVTVRVNCATSSYVRAVVTAPDGRVVGFSNPVWLLREPSRTPVPVERRAADSSW